MKEIIDVLKKFQKGYDEKNTKNIAAFMTELFSDRQDLLTLGTGAHEMCISRDEVTKLIHDDWDGGWGDFKIDIEGAKVNVEGDTAWFYADCTVKYTFENSDEKEYGRYNEYIREVVKNQDVTAKQRLSFINWVLGIHYHQRTSEKRESLCSSELSGMLIKEDGSWKMTTLHFATDKSNYPDMRFEELIENYKAEVELVQEKVTTYNNNQIDDKLLELLKNLETEMANDTKYGGLCFDQEKILMFNAGRFLWMIALGTMKQRITEDEIFERSMQEINDAFNSDLSEEDKLFATKRSIAYALKEIASGTEYTWPIRLTAIVEKTDDGYKIRDKHFSYPFYWIFEGKL